MAYGKLDVHRIYAISRPLRSKGQETCCVGCLWKWWLGSDKFISELVLSHKEREADAACREKLCECANTCDQQGPTSKISYGLYMPFSFFMAEVFYGHGW